MNAKPVLAALLAAVAFPASAHAATQAIEAPPAIYEDGQREVAVRVSFGPGTVIFSAYLPVGWAFSIDVDGDQNRAWGNGPETGRAGPQTSGDRSFGQDSRYATLCGQYILTSVPGRPEETYASTECGVFPTRGRAEISALDDRNRNLITYIIPAAEIFGTRRDAHLRACVYDGQRHSCQHSPSAPFVLRNPDAP